MPRPRTRGVRQFETHCLTTFLDRSRQLLLVGKRIRDLALKPLEKWMKQNHHTSSKFIVLVLVVKPPKLDRDSIFVRTWITPAEETGGFKLMELHCPYLQSVRIAGERLHFVAFNLVIYLYLATFDGRSVEHLTVSPNVSNSVDSDERFSALLRPSSAPSPFRRRKPSYVDDTRPII